MKIGDLVQMIPKKMKQLGKVTGVVVEVDQEYQELVKVYWGDYGTFWTSTKLLNFLTIDGINGEQSSI